MTTKIVSQLDADGYFISETVADESPLEPGVFLFPAGSVDSAPPFIEEGKRAKWVNDGWVIEDIPQPEPEPDPEPQQPTKIQSVTMRQARLALLGAGLLDEVDVLISQIIDPSEKKAAQIEWEYAQTVDRSSPFTQQLAAGLGLSDEELDNLFSQAAAL